MAPEEARRSELVALSLLDARRLSLPDIISAKAAARRQPSDDSRPRSRFGALGGLNGVCAPLRNTMSAERVSE